ncbi:YebG family protein [Marinobacter sp.]|uniref:YebG family protein n=1 Tax=Marinobacter sp. TaxID=50741 RepID=UPI00356B48ED
MAVQAVYFSDKDGLDMALKHPDTLLFTNKAEADARDKVLELSEEIREFLTRKVDGLDEQTADRCALAIAENRDLFQKALKKPQLLNADETSDA